MARQSKRLSLLLVEDDHLLRRALRRRLMAEGFLVTDVGLSSSALDLIAASAKFDIGVLDIDLPDMSGVHLAPLLLERAAVGRVVFFSAAADEPTLAMAERHGPVIAKRKGVEALLFVLLQFATSAR